MEFSIKNYLRLLLQFAVLDPKRWWDILSGNEMLGVAILAYSILLFIGGFFLIATIQLIWAQVEFIITMAQSRFFKSTSTEGLIGISYDFCLRGGSWNKNRFASLSFVRSDISFYLNDRGIRVVRTLTSNEISELEKTDNFES